jgi:hypothetical protein
MPLAGEASIILPSMAWLAQGNQRSQYPPAARRIKPSFFGDVQRSVREFMRLDLVACRIKIRKRRR